MELYGPVKGYLSKTPKHRGNGRRRTFNCDTYLEALAKMHDIEEDYICSGITYTKLEASGKYVFALREGKAGTGVAFGQVHTNNPSAGEISWIKTTN